MKFEGRESGLLEFKRELPSKKQIVNTVIGFCNLHGGRIVIGVDDNGNIIGIDEEKIGLLTDKLHRAIVSTCTPPIIPFIYSQRLGEKVVLVIEVSAGMNKPYYRSSKGVGDGTYIRMGPETIKATAEMVLEIQWEAQGHSLDELPVYHTPLEQIDAVRVKDFLTDKGRATEDISSQDLLFQHGLLTEEHRQRFPSVAGLLLFGKEPQKSLPEAFIICSHFRGTLGREAIATQDCKGTLFAQLDQAMTFIESRINRSFTIEGLVRTERLEIPRVAIREVVVNAIVHRNYHMLGPIRIGIYEDRIEIFSPGNFPRPIPLSQLEAGISLARNSIICQFFRDAKLIERLGSGWITLFTAYRERRLPKPEVKEGTGFVKVILPRPHRSQTDTVAEDELSLTEHIMKLFIRQSDLSAKDVIEQLDVSRQTASRILGELVREGKITRIGKGAATRYQRKEREF